MSAMELEFEHTFSIKNKNAGLTEPSGLTCSSDGCLWTVSDDTRKVFRLDTQGQILSTIDVDSRGMEGLTIDSKGRLWVVDEDASRILALDPETGKEVRNRRLKDLKGYCAISEYFKGARNKGLEGITYDPVRSEILLLKEAKPGLLIAVDSKLKRLVAIDRLNRRNGFDDDDSKSPLDFSGMCYDSARDLIWIVSDQRHRVYLFDRRQGRAVQSFDLNGGQGDRIIRKAEGVAVNPESNRLYIVSDKDAELSVFRIL
jgi:uncharacterized protein YjiK